VDNVEDPRHLELADAVRTISRLHDAIENPDAIPQSSVRELYRSAIESLFAQDFDTALRGFIEIIRNDRYYDNDGSRKACIAVFKILGEEHEITLKHRRDFSSALYV
jgi:putative thioredoxin